MLIVEDEQLMRQVLRTLIGDEADFEVVGDTGSTAEAISLARRVHPDVVLMDICLSRTDLHSDGIEATREILKWSPRTSVLMLTSHESKDFLFAALRAGARGYLLKTSPVEEMVWAVRAAARGESWLHPAMARMLVESVTHKGVEPTFASRPLLTERELQVLSLMVKGSSNRDIAQSLFLSEKTVKQHASKIFKKLNVRGRAQAALYAIQHGLTG